MIGRILALSLIAGLAGGGAWYKDLQTKKLALDEKKIELATAKADETIAEAKLAEKRKELAEIQEKSAAMTGRSDLKLKLTEQIVMLESERSNALQAFASDVQGVRARFTGVLLPELRLQDGMVLRDVRFQEIGNTTVTIAHSGGQMSFSPASLPADLRDKLRIDMVPMKEASGTLVAQPAVAQSPSVATVPTSTTAPKTAQLEASIREMETKMAEYNRTRETYIRQVEDYRRKDVEATVLQQRPQYTRVIPQIDRALSDISTKIAELNMKVGELKFQIENSKVTN